MHDQLNIKPKRVILSTVEMDVAGASQMLVTTSPALANRAPQKSVSELPPSNHSLS